MQDILLLAAAAAIFGLGWILMKKLDFFLENHCQTLNPQLRYGFLSASHAIIRGNMWNKVQEIAVRKGEKMKMSGQDPDSLLRPIRKDMPTGSRGKLKIFFGYAAGSGKTYAMLQAAHQAKERGMDVVAGYIEPHGRPQTMALLCGLEQIPTKQIQQDGIILREFDIDAALKRRPQIILVDEFAHTNAEGSRHAKRYQDVEELLNAGINVYTTVNVQHIESLNDMVASITGTMVKERIPDSVFDQANQVELVDIEPEELLERMARESVSQREQAECVAENLTALREVALRRCADRVNLLTESARIHGRSEYHTDEHILVCLSSSPSNAKIIRTAARMARAFRGTFTALFVETPGGKFMNESDKKRLRENMRLAEQLLRPAMERMSPIRLPSLRDYPVFPKL